MVKPDYGKELLDLKREAEYRDGQIEGLVKDTNAIFSKIKSMEAQFTRMANIMNMFIIALTGSVTAGVEEITEAAAIATIEAKGKIPVKDIYKLEITAEDAEAIRKGIEQEALRAGFTMEQIKESMAEGLKYEYEKVVTGPVPTRLSKALSAMVLPGVILAIIPIIIQIATTVAQAYDSYLAEQLRREIEIKDREMRADNYKQVTDRRLSYRSIVPG